MVLALALLASGCGGQTQPNQTETNVQKSFEMLKKDLSHAQTDHETCYAEVNSHPDSIAAKEILPLDDPGKASIKQMASTARPTPDQMRKIVAYKQNLDRCDERVVSDLNFSVVGFYTLSQKKNQKLDGIIVDLTQKKLNLGGAVQAAQLESQRFQTEAKSLFDKSIASLVHQQNAEIAQRDAEMAQRQVAQAQREADLAAFGAAMQSTSNQFLQGQQQLPQATTNFQPPQVMPITPPGGNQVRCINAGIYTNCRY